ncbi:CHAT domain-containing protein [Geodermatophilus siccatus]|uniref:CHAT domain-containing protein n=1 Tax=Geodermatophilus siccatus TaxID=1137991 RepID=A0A1G9QHK7_9ACTN|nr:CHAT domain-containing protein [Geodermatophilus siccatus]SDM10466.1 CHAT domain-containing protein [Geodermatophilus siccatus]
MDDGYEYRIVVDTDLRGFRSGPGETVPTEVARAPRTDDALQRETVRVLRLWLDRWPAIRQQKKLPVPDTFKLLGSYLYRTVFREAVETKFREVREEAERDDLTLRVDLALGPGAGELAEWPWELLYSPDWGGEFLAKASGLVLSRSLNQTRFPNRHQDPPLRVYCIIAVPDTPAYAAQREELTEALTGMTEYSRTIQPEITERWNQKTVQQRLRTAPHPHIIHFVGVCRRRWEGGVLNLQICLDDGSGGHEWASTTALVDLLASGGTPRGENRARLAVLHLSEPSPLDFDVTFERLAPALIQRGIPAVLAMQYPLTGEPAARFIRLLYEKIAEHKSIEEAVQCARGELFVDLQDDLAFGSPVLYMQSLDSQLLPGADAVPGTAGAGPGGVVTTLLPAGSLRDALLAALTVLPESPVTAGVRLEVERNTWPDSAVGVGQLLARRIRESVSRPDELVVYEELARVVSEWERGGGLLAG